MSTDSIPPGRRVRTSRRRFVQGLAAGGAVARNRVKRRVREYFRQHRHLLPMVDLVVNARAAAAGATNAETSASLASHWRRVSERCARS